MDNITERRQHGTISLSHTQKFVLAKLISSETPLVAYESVSRGPNIVAARDQLAGLGLMTVAENDAQITDVGKEAMQQEGLVDEMGELTEQGQEYGYAEGPEDIEKLAASNRKPEAPVAPNSDKPAVGGNMPIDTTGVSPQDAGGPDAFQIESLEMVQSFNQSLKEQKWLKKKAII